MSGLQAVRTISSFHEGLASGDPDASGSSLRTLTCSVYICLYKKVRSNRCHSIGVSAHAAAIVEAVTPALYAVGTAVPV